MKAKFSYLALPGFSTMGMDTMDRPVRVVFFRLGLRWPFFPQRPKAHEPPHPIPTQLRRQNPRRPPSLAGRRSQYRHRNGHRHAVDIAVNPQRRPPSACTIIQHPHTRHFTLRTRVRSQTLAVTWGRQVGPPARQPRLHHHSQAAAANRVVPPAAFHCRGSSACGQARQGPDMITMRKRHAKIRNCGPADRQALQSHRPPWKRSKRINLPHHRQNHQPRAPHPVSAVPLQQQFPGTGPQAQRQKHGAPSCSPRPARATQVDHKAAQACDFGAATPANAVLVARCDGQKTHPNCAKPTHFGKAQARPKESGRPQQSIIGLTLPLPVHLRATPPHWPTPTMRRIRQRRIQQVRCSTPTSLHLWRSLAWRPWWNVANSKTRAEGPTSRSALNQPGRSPPRRIAVQATDPGQNSVANTQASAATKPFPSSPAAATAPDLPAQLMPWA